MLFASGSFWFKQLLCKVNPNLGLVCGVSALF